MSAQPPVPYPASQSDKRPSPSPHSSSSLSPEPLKRANNSQFSYPNLNQSTSPPSSTNPPTNNGFGNATDPMIGPSAPWDPTNSAIPSYPSEETLLARYRAYSESFPAASHQQHQQTQTATLAQQHGHPLRRDSQAYHERNADESRNSTSSGHYSTAMYGALSPESLQSAGSPQSMGSNVPGQQQQQQPQYYTPGAQSFYSSPPFDASWPMGAMQSPPDYVFNHPQLGGASMQQQQQQQQDLGHAAYPPHPRSTAPGYGYPQIGGNGGNGMHPSYQSTIGVNPSHITDQGGRSVSGGQAGARPRAHPEQSNPQTRPMVQPRKATQPISTNGGGRNPPIQSMDPRSQAYRSQPRIAPRNSVSTKGPDTKKRKLVEEEDESSSSSDGDYLGDTGATGAGSSQQGLLPGGRLPGACAPCKRLKMKCLFPDGENVCQRCRNSGRAEKCIVGPRKPRQPSNKKELLLQKLREQDNVIKQKDAIMKSLIEQLQDPNKGLTLKEPRVSPSISSSAIDSQSKASRGDEPAINKEILEWVERAKASVTANPGYRMYDGRGAYDSDSPSESSPTSLLSPTKSNLSDSGRSASYLAAPDAQGHHSAKSSPKLGTLPLETSPLGLLAELSIKEAKEKNEKRARSRSKSGSASGADDGKGTDQGSSAEQAEEDDEGALGPPSKGYFQPAVPWGLRTIQAGKENIPEIMASSLISPAEVDKLFKIFFDRLNVFVSILDPKLHTPATTFGRSPFLFTVVCAISSRYYTERPELYSIAMHFARRAAAASLIDGTKSVELCQAYILMSIYSLQSRRWEDAREWLYLGLAIRMATDLNLHVRTSTKIVSEQHERELLNRTRTWLICYNLDRSSSAQLGKPASIRPDPIIRRCKTWWKSSKFNDPFDLHLCAYTELLSTIVAEFQERVYWNPQHQIMGLRTDLDLVAVALEFDDRLKDWNSKTAVSFATYSDSSNSQCIYRSQLLPFYVNYLRLVMLSLGFQQAVQKGVANVSPGIDVVKRCLDAACGVVRTVVEDLAPTGYFRFAPDGHFVFSSFASAFLIKLLRPEHDALLEADERSMIIDLVQRLVDMLKDPRIAVDERHTPMLYSRFLAGLLSKYKPGEDDATDTEKSRADTAELSTPPPSEQQPDMSRAGKQPSGAVHSGYSHRPSPSIEISPPAPEPGYDQSGGVPSTQSMFDAWAMDSTLLPPNQTVPDDSNVTSYAASTVHPASTVHGGSQYGMADSTMMDSHILAPMMAMDNDAFWTHVMPPGLSWPSEEAVQWATDFNMEDYSNMGLHPEGDHGYYHQGQGQMR